MMSKNSATNEVLFSSAFYDLSKCSDDMACVKGVALPRGQEKTVLFAENSSMCFIPATEQRSEKAYSKLQIQAFKSRAAIDALRIRSLIAQQKEQHRSTRKAVQYAMNEGLLQYEHLLGIEHQIFADSGIKRALERKTHVEAVLDAQKLMKEKCNNQADCVEKLAKFAAMSSAKNVEAAFLKASWSDVIPRRKTVDPPARVHTFCLDSGRRALSFSKAPVL